MSDLENCCVKKFKGHSWYCTITNNVGWVSAEMSHQYLHCIINQRNIGPVNAHLISGPTVSTKTSFANLDIVLKWVKVNSLSSFI